MKLNEQQLRLRVRKHLRDEARKKTSDRSPTVNKKRLRLRVRKHLRESARLLNEEIDLNIDKIADPAADEETYPGMKKKLEDMMPGNVVYVGKTTSKPWVRFIEEDGVWEYAWTWPDGASGVGEAFELGDESDYTGPQDGYGNCIKRGRCRSWS